jgi:hypothetical protein
MDERPQERKSLLKQLGGGLILRRATPDDGEVLAAFNARVHQSENADEPEERVGVWTRDLVELPHPTFQPSDFTIVEEQSTGVIVSSLNLISQIWSYAGIDFKVGRPELVGTDPDYRERGLIRTQFETIHQWSYQRGEMVQAITGIPYYYRIFGYEMAMELEGGRVGFFPQVPKLEHGESEPYHIRAAGEGDLPFLMDLYSQANQRYLVSCVRDEQIWRYELNGRSPNNVNRPEVKVIEDQDGESVGYLLHPPYRWGGMMPATGYEIRTGNSWGKVTPTVIRYLKSTGMHCPPVSGKDREPDSFGFWLGSDHPVYKVIPDRLPRVRDPYAWYLRVPDLPGFIQHIAPALEARLNNSPLAGHSGEIRLTFYRSGLRIVFEKGKIVGVEAWKPSPYGHSGDAGFPGLTFLQLVFCYRSLAELKFAFADCWTRDDLARALLEILFPKMVSRVWPVS